MFEPLIRSLVVQVFKGPVVFSETILHGDWGIVWFGEEIVGCRYRNHYYDQDGEKCSQLQFDSGYDRFHLITIRRLNTFSMIGLRSGSWEKEFESIFAKSICAPYVQFEISRNRVLKPIEGCGQYDWISSVMLQV